MLFSPFPLQGALNLRHLYIPKYYGSWLSSDPDQTERAVIELLWRRPGLAVRTLESYLGPLHFSEYERLGIEPSTSARGKAWMPRRPEAYDDASSVESF